MQLEQRSAQELKREEAKEKEAKKLLEDIMLIEDLIKKQGEGSRSYLRRGKGPSLIHSLV